MQIPGLTAENLIENSQLETAAPLDGVQPAYLCFSRLDYCISSLASLPLILPHSFYTQVNHTSISTLVIMLHDSMSCFIFFLV